MNTRFTKTSMILLSALAVQARAADTPPRYESLKEDMVYMREGPSTEHRVKWVYHRKGLPVEVLSEFEVWRRVRDPDGEIGWVHAAMLTRERTALVTGHGLTPVRRREDSTSPVLAQAQAGAIGHLETCGPVACEVKFP